MYCIIFQGNIPPQELTTIPNELAYAIYQISFPGREPVVYCKHLRTLTINGATFQTRNWP